MPCEHLYFGGTRCDWPEDTCGCRDSEHTCSPETCKTYDVELDLEDSKCEDWCLMGQKGYTGHKGECQKHLGQTLVGNVPPADDELVPDAYKVEDGSQYTYGELRSEIAQSLEAVKAGKFCDAEEVLERLQDRIDELFPKEDNA